MAEAIARKAMACRDSRTERPVPLYVKGPDAAPARDAGPKILS